MIGQSFDGLTLVLLKNEEAQPPVMVDPTWGMAIKMWWWMGWRALVLWMLLSILDGVIGLIIGNQLWVQIPITLLSVLIGIYWYQKIIGQSFGGATLGLLKPDQTA
ncbi:hypothetical protein EBZ35_08380 [bacterium]|nr:hypothetical protein [bacterium]